MIDVSSETCTGCGACVVVCPKSCIRMVPDAEGFAVPVIDEDSCVGCGLCERRCPEMHREMFNSRDQVSYALKWRSISPAIERSASGGAFFALALTVLEQGGAVYGAAFDKSYAVRHIRARTKDELTKIQGSKYVQSDIGSTYLEVAKDLSEGRQVLFSGTPCQIAALYACVKGDSENLYTVDVVCHGVASPELFSKYLEWVNEKYGRLREYSFRSKRFGWGNVVRIEGERRQRYVSSSDPYNKAYMGGACYREVCYKCKYAQQSRVSDITICDFWGIQSQHPDFYRKDGVSGVLVNSDHGSALFKRVWNRCEVLRVDFGSIAAHNGNLKAPSKRPPVRGDLYKGICELSGREFVEKRLVPLIGFKDRIKALIPFWVKYPIRRALKRF